MRRLEAVDPVVAEVVCLALEAKDPQVRLAACRDVLDRVGMRETPESAGGAITPELEERETAAWRPT